MQNEAFEHEQENIDDWLEVIQQCLDLATMAQCFGFFFLTFGPTAVLTLGPHLKFSCFGHIFDPFKWLVLFSVHVETIHFETFAERGDEMWEKTQR